MLSPLKPYASPPLLSARHPCDPLVTVHTFSRLDRSNIFWQILSNNRWIFDGLVIENETYKKLRMIAQLSGTLMLRAESFEAILVVTLLPVISSLSEIEPGCCCNSCDASSP